MKKMNERNIELLALVVTNLFVERKKIVPATVHYIFYSNQKSYHFTIHKVTSTK